MDKEDFIQLTNKLYKLTLLFPKKEPLRYKMRELADEILENLISASLKNLDQSRNLVENSSLPILKDMEVLDSFFEIAKKQNWVSSSDILEIQKEYSKIREELEKHANLDANSMQRMRMENPVKEIRKNVSLSERQQKILEILKEKGKAQVWEIKKIFPELTKRTLRRDFEKLLNQGKIERIGERNNTFYQIKIG